jgi:hypothetical protein
VRSRIALACCFGLALGARSLPGQRSQGTVIVRAELATLNPEETQIITPAYGAALGQMLGNAAVLIRWFRQDVSSIPAENPFTTWRNWLGLDWEYAFGEMNEYHRQVLVRFGAGALLRPGGLRTVPYLGLGFGMRYPISNWLGFTGRLEDDLAFLPAETTVDCGGAAPVTPADSTFYCISTHRGHHAQHNYGVFLGVELRP